MNQKTKPDWRERLDAKNKEFKEKALENYKDDYDFSVMGEFAGDLAIIMENQRLMNDALPKNDPIDLQLIYDIYTKFLGWHLVSIQPMLGPASLVYYPKFQRNEVSEDIDLNLVSEEIAARTRKLRTVDLDSEGDLSERIANEMTREVATDLRNNAGTVATRTDADDRPLYLAMMEVSGVIHRKTLIDGSNWIYTTPSLAEELFEPYGKGATLVKSDAEIYKAGVMGGRWSVYVDTKAPENEILIGYRGREPDAYSQRSWYYKAGYFYCPYIALTKTPGINTEDFSSRGGYLMRYGKKLTREGAKYYAKLKIE